jgi:cell migration-inducing and hyaluronan-binding protein
VAGAPPAALPAVTLTRNGKDYTLTGETNVRAGSEFKVSTDRPTVALNVKELESGSWVIFELPGFTAATEGTEQSSLDALRTATSTSYYKSNGALWVKLVSTGDVLGSGSGKGPGGGVTLTASR